MKTATKAIFIFITFGLISCNTNNHKETPKTTDQVKHLYEKDLFNFYHYGVVGHWTKNCNSDPGFIEILKTSDIALMEINSNQVTIRAKIKIDSSNNKLKLLFKLVKPDDLGAGGMRLHWQDFSKDSIIAKMTIVDTLQAKLTWYGFYDKRMKRRVWRNDSDFLNQDSSSNEIRITKCHWKTE